MYTFDLEDEYKSYCIEPGWNCFEIVKGLLEDIENEVQFEDQSLIREMEFLSKNYEGEKLCSNYKGIDYSYRSTQIAYAYTYIASHAEIVFRILNSSLILREEFYTDVLNIASFGSGPGSEVLGILKYVNFIGAVPRLTFHLHDREPLWRNISDKLLHKNLFSPEDKVHLHCLDVLDLNCNVPCESFDAKIYTMVYLLSELYVNEKKASPLLKSLLAKMEPGSIILFIDNAHRNYYDWFDKMLELYDFELLLKKDCYDFYAEDDGRLYCLKSYYDRFYPRLYRKKARVAYRICRKGSTQYDHLS